MFSTSLVRSLLEYATLIWDHNNLGHNDQLEIVQNKALRFICHNCDIQKTPHTRYDNIYSLIYFLLDQQQKIYTVSLIIYFVIKQYTPIFFLLNIKKKYVHKCLF